MVDHITYQQHQQNESQNQQQVQQIQQHQTVNHMEIELERQLWEELRLLKE